MVKVDNDAKRSEIENHVDVEVVNDEFEAKTLGFSICTIIIFFKIAWHPILRVFWVAEQGHYSPV